MRKFEMPIMEIQRLASEDVLTSSDCRVEALGCTSCYCVAVDCGTYCDAQTCDEDCFTDA